MKENRQFSGKSISDKIKVYSAFNYEFSEYCKGLLPGKHSCGFMTDLKLSRDDQYLHYIPFRYYLYPVDIYFDKLANKECLVLFWKNNAKQHIPENYNALKPFSDKHIVAVKQAP